MKHQSIFANRKESDEVKKLPDCKICGNRPIVKMIKKIKTIPDIPTFDPSCLFYQVECKTCKEAGTNNATAEYNEKDAAYTEWNNTNTLTNQKVS